MDKKVILMILDGWGKSPDPKVSAIDLANTPFMDSLYKNYPNAQLRTDGMNVGLPEGQMGNSEVGHMNLGAGRIVYQDLALADNLTAAANIFLGREKLNPWGLLDYRAMYKRAGELFAELKSETRPRDLVRKMSGGQRQAVAIARTRLSEPKIVLMDEPTAAISVRQVAEVLNLIRRLRDQGMAVVLISHRMPDIFSVCDRLVVLRRGTKVGDKRVSDSSPEEVTGLITGAIERV